MVYRRYGRWKRWIKSQATQYLRQELSAEVEKWKKEGNATTSPLLLEQFVLHSGRIGGAINLAVMGTSTLVIWREGRWFSNALLTYVMNGGPAMGVGGIVGR